MFWDVYDVSFLRCCLLIDARKINLGSFDTCEAISLKIEISETHNYLRKLIKEYKNSKRYRKEKRIGTNFSKSVKRL